jgi:glycosyltransferase involved in cell wall biosynthesis
VSSENLMKVIIVAPHFHPLVGGVEVYTMNIASQLRDLGWQVVVVTTGNEAGNEVAGLPGVRVHRLAPAFTLSNTPVGYGWRWELGRIYRAEQPDIINGHTPVPYLADVAQRASKSVPFVLTYHNDLAKESIAFKAMSRGLQATIIDRTLRRSTGIIATSDYYLSSSPYLTRYASKVSVVSPGVDLTKFNPEIVVGSDLTARYSGKRVILFVGSLNRSRQHKGLDHLIRAVAMIRPACPDVRLVVAGSGDWLANYKSIASRAGVAGCVDFAGHISDEKLAQYYKLAKMLAMPSTNRSEGFGMVYIEAGAVGIPVVGSRIGGVPQAVRDNDTGILVEPRNAEDLASALRRLLDDDALARRLGRAGAARAKAEFDWRALGMRTSEIFGELAGKTVTSADGPAERSAGRRR